eukprot:5666618-Karenia_brevis.AAC.1
MKCAETHLSLFTPGAGEHHNGAASPHFGSRFRCQPHEMGTCTLRLGNMICSDEPLYELMTCAMCP